MIALLIFELVAKAMIMIMICTVVHIIIMIIALAIHLIYVSDPPYIFSCAILHITYKIPAQNLEVTSDRSAVIFHCHIFTMRPET